MGVSPRYRVLFERRYDRLQSYPGGCGPMKRLYLVRHAQASPKDLQMSDAQRSLDARGEKQAAWLGDCLNQRGAKPDLILSSPAKRALRTASVIAEELKIPRDVITVRDSLYLANMTDLSEIIRDLDDEFKDVMLFAHNPGITRFAQDLLGEWVERMPPCSIYCLDFTVRSWKVVTGGNAKLVFYDYPTL
jgi:phosphohistidine phosphatase